MDGESSAAPALVERFRRMPAWRFDALLTTIFVVTAVFTTRRPLGADPDGWGFALILVASAPYYLRRAAPLLVLAVSLAATAVLFLDGYDGGPLPIMVAWGTYTVGSRRPLREVVAAAVFTGVTLLVMLVGDSPRFAVPEFVTSVPVYAATLLVGWSLQSRRQRYDALEREQDAVSARAAADERLRIAQELHDVIGHSLGVIAVQSGVGMHLIDTDPAEAKRALEHISRTSRTSLAEIRRLLGLVRVGEDAAYAPTPGLGDLPRLADDVTAAGLPVSLTVSPDARDLPPGVELAAYRIVQEALTNARKHAAARGAAVSLDVEDGALRVVVTDDGKGSEGRTGGGHGVIGMRERVAVYGGALDVGPAPDGGYRVSATIPFEESS